MRHLKLFFACMLMAVLSIGQMWATDFTLSSAAEVTKDGITVSFAKGSGGTAPTWYAAGLRFYASNTITISCDDDITGVTFNWEKQGSKAFASVTASTGSYSHPTAAGEGTWSGFAKSITFTLGGSGQLQLNTFSVTTDGGGSSDPTLSVDPTVIDFGTVEQNAVVASQTVEVSFANLTGSVAYSGLSSPFTASGTISSTGDEITIAANTATIGEYSQTLTVQSAADSKSAEVTVKMNVVAPFDGLKLTFDVSANPGGWPTTNSTTTTNYTYTLNEVDYTFALNNVKCNSGYLMLTSVAKLGLPAISGYKLVKVEATNSGSCSTTTQVSVSSSDATKTDVTGGTAQTWGTTSTKYTYNLSGTEENTMYYLWIANKNCQMVELTLYYEEAEAAAVATPVISGTESFLTSTEVSIACTTDGATVYYTTDGTDPKTSESKQSGTSFTLYNSATVRAIANKGSDWSSEATSKTFTKITPLTVAEALVEATGSGKYVTGTITSITEVNIGYKNATYVISDISAGIPQNEMIVYRGKYIGGADFTSADQIHVGDVVVVSGSIAVHAEKNQMAQGNQIETISAPAVAAPVFEPNGGGFMGETDVTITCATGSSTIYYTLDGTNPTKLSTLYEGAIHLDATTTITAIAYVGEESSLVVAKEFTLTAPMTVAEALTALDSEDPINNAAVSGIISTAPSSNPSSGKLTYYISDDGSDTDELEVYLGYGLNGASFSAKTDLQVGDEVTVFGNLTIHNSTIKEFASGSRLLAFNRPEVAVTGIDLTESTAEVEVGKTVTLHASVVPANATNKTIVWSVQSGNDKAEVDANGVVTGIAAGEAVIRATSDEDASIYAECTVTVTEPAPLSPWASVYTSNVEIASSTAAHVTINEEDYDAAKTNKGASATITLPQGVTAIHLHLVAWNGEAQTVSVTGDCFNEAKELSIEANAGVSGSGTTYDLGASGTDYYFSLTPDNEVAANTVITIAAASNKRFVLFGVNQEGAVTLESISVSGTATALEYNEGDHFSPAGLGVTGHYSDASTAPITEGVVWAFDPDPLTEGTTSVSVIATASGKTSAAFVVDGLTVAGAAPLSPWASVYTSNVEIASNTAAHVTINEENFDAAKTSKGASATITLPQGVTTIHLHLVAWNGEAQTVSVTGDCFNEAKELSIEANAGVSGSGTTYDLGASGTDYYFSLTPDNEVAANTVITIAAASGKRFVLFGVNQEGGVVPVLDHIAISGDLDNKSYKAGQSLDMTGLTVEATYTLGGTPQTPVDITNDPGLTWTYDPLVENQDEVTVTAHFGDPEKTASKTIEGLNVTTADPMIYVDPSLTVNFGSVEVGEAVPTNKTITVTLTNVAAATATLGGTNPEAFSIDKTALVDGDVITISILANTDAAASYAATLTISDGEGGADDKTVNLSFTVNEPVTPEDPEVRKTWDLSIASYDANPTEEQVTWSATYVNMVVDKYNATTKANNYLGGDANNRTSSRFYQNSKLTITPNGKEITYVVFTATSAGYANALQGSEWTNASASVDGTTVTVTPTDGKNAIIAVVGGTCGFTAVQVNYKNIAPEPPVLNWEDGRTGLTAGKYYTICLPKKVTHFRGASVWNMNKRNAAETEVYLEEAELPFAAGTPFIIQATADKLEVVYEGAETSIASTNGALVGTLTGLDVDAFAALGGNIYILKDNAIRPRTTGNWLSANRAYIDYDELIEVSEAPTSMPGKKVRKMPMQPQTPTGLDELNAGNQPMKVMINGQLYILRGEKMYNANGQVVK